MGAIIWWSCGADLTIKAEKDWLDERTVTMHSSLSAFLATFIYAHIIAYNLITVLLHRSISDAAVDICVNSACQTLQPLWLRPPLNESSIVVPEKYTLILDALVVLLSEFFPSQSSCFWLLHLVDLHDVPTCAIAMCCLHAHWTQTAVRMCLFGGFVKFLFTPLAPESQILHYRSRFPFKTCINHATSILK